MNELPEWVHQGQVTSPRQHRGRVYDDLWYAKSPGKLNSWRIDGIHVVIVRFVDDSKYWIVADVETSAFDDLGPYDTLEEALVTIRLCNKTD